MTLEGEEKKLQPAIVLMLAVWAVLCATEATAQVVGAHTALLVSFAIATAVVWGTRRGSARGSAPRLPRATVVLVGLIAGVLLMPAWHGVTGEISRAVAFESPPFLDPSNGPLVWVAVGLLAPVFEEPLYRERLLLPLRSRFGAPLAIVLTSVLFAVPHVTSGAVLSTFLAGLVLGTVMHLGRSLALCIALHAGYNLGALADWSPAALVPPVVVPAALLGTAVLAWAIWMLRRATTRTGEADAGGDTGLRHPVGSLAVAAVLVALCLWLVRLLPRESALLSPPPARALLETPTPLPPDYARAASWAALPSRSGFADLVPTSVTRRAPREARADVFFVHPTTYFDRQSWNQPLDDPEANALTDSLVLANQASVFNACCRVFAPRYRQASLAAFLTEGSDGEQARELAYQDVRRAFEFYLAHHNQGRPIVLAAHSQGSHHALRLLEGVLASPPHRERLVAAYLPGIPVPTVEPHRAAGLRVCGLPLETGCFVSWNTVASGATRAFSSPTMRTLFGRERDGNRDQVVCVNPLTWRLDGRPASPDLNLGGVVFAKEIASSGVRRLRVAGAQCVGGLLAVADVSDADLRKARGWAGDYHLLDYGLFYMNVRTNAEARVAAYLERRSRRDARRDPERIETPATAATPLAHWPGVHPK